MPALTFVDDPALDRELGPKVVEDLRASIQPKGDCIACGSPLGSERPLRIDARSVDFAIITYARHASCEPVPVTEGAVFVPPSTYRMGALLLPLHTEQGTAMMPMVILNPACDVITLYRDRSTGDILRPLEQYRRSGFTAFPDTALLGNVSSAPDVTWVRDGEQLFLDVTGQDVDMEVTDPFFEAAARCGGFAIMIVFRHDVNDLLHAPDELGRVVYAEDEALFCWVAAPTEP